MNPDLAIAIIVVAVILWTQFTARPVRPLRCRKESLSRGSS